MATGSMCLAMVLAAQAATAEDWKSRAASRALLEQMDGREAEAIAARDPETPDRFIAALRLPGQLLVVSAAHPSADLVASRLERGEYRNVYMDLQATPHQDTKFFVQDLNADGIDLEGRGQAFDIVYEGRDSLSCDGRWKATKMKEDEYRQRVAAADARYARLLTVLAGHLDGPEPSR
jgi:hypothetical protein